MAGRRPKPTALHRLQGTYHSTDHGTARAYEARATGAVGPAPKGLTVTQRQAWRYAVKHAPAGVLKAIDREMLRLWVETVEYRDEARRQLALSGDWERSPCHAVVARTTQLLARLANELGFSPAARPRIHLEAPPPTDDAANPWAALRLVQHDGE